MYLRILGAQVSEVRQLTFLDLLLIGIVFDVVIRGEPAVMEIGLLVQPRVAVMREFGARHAGAPVDACHVVDHRVGDHLHAVLVAGVHHALELVAGAELRLQLVAHWLIARPPLLAFDVLLRGGEQDELEVIRAEYIRALFGYGVPVVLEQLDADVRGDLGLTTRRCLVAGAAGGHQHRRSGQEG